MQRNARDWRVPVGYDNAARAGNDGYFSAEAGGERFGDGTTGDQFAVGGGTAIAVVRLRNFRDAAKVGEYFRQGIPVIINLEDLDNAGSYRVIDFVSGLILGLNGDLEKISRRSFLLVPADSSILNVHDGMTEEGFFNQE